MKSQTPDVFCAEGVFLMQSTPYLLPLQIICQGQTEHDTTFERFFNYINFKYKYFHNSVDCSGLYLQVYIPS